MCRMYYIEINLPTWKIVFKNFGKFNFFREDGRKL